MVQQWVPDRVLVKFTVEGMQKASLPNPGEKTFGQMSRTGIVSLDKALDETSVVGLRVAFPEAANKAAAVDLGANRWFILDLASGADVPAVAKRLAGDANLAEALPDLVVFPAVIPNDPMHSAHWGHNNTVQLPGFDWGGSYEHTLAGVGTPSFDSNAHAAWGAEQGYGDSGVVIAIIDTGVDPGHPDLLQVTGYDFGDNDSNPEDDSSNVGGHGTACAGVAAAIADNLLGVAGVAGGSSIMPLKVANSSGSMSLSYVTSAIYYAANNGADIISMSLGAATTSYSSTDEAITYAYNHGLILLAATGNENFSQIGYPAYHPLVLGVGAASPCGDRKRSSSDIDECNPGVSTDPNGYTCDGERWWGSNYGSTVQDHQGAVDIIAPTILPTTDIQGNDGYEHGDYSSFFNGTSCATPYAAGVCALIKSANPSFTPNQIRAQLVGTAIDIQNVESGVGWDRYSGYGMVDAAEAVGAVVPPGALAAFIADDTTGCSPFTVNFTDESTGPIDSWVWNFGDGMQSISQNPSHTYSDPGVYDVGLAVTSPDGDDSIVKFGYIIVGAAPSPSFTSSVEYPEFISAGESVDFTDTSTGDPTSWLWDFGDGGSSTLQSPTHFFNTSGAFSITLTVTNSCGSEFLTVPNLILVIPSTAPVADFSFSPATGCAPLEVEFTDESTGSITAWAWDFGDGATGTEASPTHTYTTPGVFDVRLIVTSESDADTVTVAGAVVVEMPVAAAFTVSDTLGAAPLEVTFTDASAGDPTSWLWDFGDASTDTVANPTHTYLTEGLFDVTLIVGNACSVDTLVMVAAVEVDGVSALGELAPLHFGLGSNYPNPFNPSTTIVFSLENPGRTRLEVFDVSGRRVATLVDEEKSAGRYEISWRPADLASGVYFSRLTVGDLTDTRRVTLLK
ncbi:MAG: PKD domain-containing protein [Gemmatimonadales bacterium]|nr:PKD domain-containing protein [Gemmatimonadales bacterium]